jgi:hypothetical protein
LIKAGFLTGRLVIRAMSIEAYPQLKRDIQAAMRYAADTLSHEEMVFIDNDHPVQPDSK